ncbi:hypothetical protein ACE3MZ_11475 [Paenibacillus sp. WLX1005]|uniref:hypothetical protein n=1 Tax=Paenibacillus sp. WLX1005 TaxID=3243766 RepID=UPI003983FAAC
MDSDSVKYITYDQRHMDIIQAGIEPIQVFLQTESQQEKDNLLFCMDRFLDPWFGYQLPHLEQIFVLLQQHLFTEETVEINNVILELLTQYGRQTLDVIADQIEQLEPELLADAVYALGMTYNRKYIAIVEKYQSHDDPVVQKAASEAIHELNLSTS